MKITSKQLKEWSACTEGFEFFVKKCGKSIELKKFAEIFAAENQFDWAWWVIKKLLKKEQSVKIAIFAAEKVIDIFEKKYPEDKRPRQAIEAAKAWLKNPTEENRLAAYAAAGAGVGAYAAYAYAAAAYAAYAAAGAAYAYAAAKIKMKTDILFYAVDVLEGKKL